ncbi:MAG: zf-HC2 domain-containing protein [Myxococcales bacterium]|nr:zf-HC2 domain-containing protein [Myxococcales bacterium]
MTAGCDEARRWTDAYLDGELDPSAAVHVEAHLAGCAGCKAELESVRSLKKVLAGQREESAPTALRFRVLAALDAEDEHVAREVSAQKRKRHGLGVALTGAALASVVLMQGLRARQGMPFGADGARGPTPMMAGLLPVVEDVAQRHARELPSEVEASDPAQVAQWFRGKLDIPVRPVLFHGVPARLVGGRISNVRDHLAAALYYDVGGRRMTVFVYDAGVLPQRALLNADNDDVVLQRAMVQGRPVLVTSSHGYTVTLTEQQGVGYAIASDMPPQECARVLAGVELR